MVEEFDPSITAVVVRDSAPMEMALADRPTLTFSPAMVRRSEHSPPLDPLDARVSQAADKGREPLADRGNPDKITSFPALQDGSLSKPFLAPGNYQDAVDSRLQVQSDPGEALATLLEGISPEVFGNQALFEDIVLGCPFDDAMDWVRKSG